MFTVNFWNAHMVTVNFWITHMFTLNFWIAHKTLYSIRCTQDMSQCAKHKQPRVVDASQRVFQFNIQLSASIAEVAAAAATDSEVAGKFSGAGATVAVTPTM